MLFSYQNTQRKQFNNPKTYNPGKKKNTFYFLQRLRTVFTFCDTCQDEQLLRRGAVWRFLSTFQGFQKAFLSNPMVVFCLFNKSVVHDQKKKHPHDYQCPGPKYPTSTLPPRSRKAPSILKPNAPKEWPWALPRNSFFERLKTRC